MNKSALQHQILNCFALRASLTSTEVWSDIMSNTDQFWTKRHIQDELGELFRAGRISRRQRTKKAAFIYHVALENVEPKPEVFIDNPILNRPEPESVYKFVARFLLIGGGAIWWVERAIDLLEWIF